ncbi:type II secretion system minor pseudopilin GspI [Pseudidiomarina marina]|uniref:Type II secretion system protein I n=1 Tax=Pseudidiomarina marina TaxID=502366 RepID=A0A432YFC8_9GAMM|nr:type II secretion system minor pseudopilin GspI [Pseudidiomarina marina]RUO59649.1 type II secretion system protein GspI [Pseudidiomarina marina]
MYRNSRGFTLVEVMFALGIFALAALAAVAATSQHLNDLNYMQDKSMAQYAAANAMARVSLEYPPKNGASGTELVGSRQWYWRSQVVKTQTDDVFYVTVRVFAEQPNSPDATDGSLVTLSRYLGPDAESNDDGARP